jgi:hypothetical protein
LLNLKATKYDGFKSHGLLLCAMAPSSSQGNLNPHDEKTQKHAEGYMEILGAPAAAVNGERIFLARTDVATKDAIAMAVASEGQMKKQKIWDKVRLALETNEFAQGACDHALLMTSAGPCAASSLVMARIA